MDNEHFDKLSNMYLSAPINQYYNPVIKVSSGNSEIIVQVKEDFFHGGNAVHGSVYFKMLDDSAYFAANSLERGYMLLTVSFTIQFIRPITNQYMKAHVTVIQRGKRIFFADSILYDYKDRICAKGNGTFVKGDVVLDERCGYK